MNRSISNPIKVKLFEELLEKVAEHFDQQQYKECLAYMDLAGIVRSSLDDENTDDMQRQIRNFREFIRNAVMFLKSKNEE